MHPWSTFAIFTCARCAHRKAHACGDASLPFEELYSRALLHSQYNHFNVLLLAALAQASAMDVILAECSAPRLLPSLKRESARCKGRPFTAVFGTLALNGA